MPVGEGEGDSDPSSGLDLGWRCGGRVIGGAQRPLRQGCCCRGSVARSPWAVAPTGSQDGSILIPRYFQWVAAAPKMEKRLRGFWSQPGLILGVGSNCFGAREKRPGCVKELRNRIKPSISGGYVSKARRLLNPGEIVVPTFQTSGLAGLQGNGTSQLLGATGRRGQPISTVNSLKTAKNQNSSVYL